MKKYLFLFILFSCLVASCVKDPPTTFEATVKGRVLEVDSEVGIPNMTVKLVEEDYTPAGSQKRTTLKTVKTDAQGNYQFTYTRQTILNYDVVAVNSSPDYNEYTQAMLIPDGASNVVNVFLSPFGWLEVHVKNVSPVGLEDVLNFNYGIFVGKNVDTIIVAKEVSSKTLQRPIGIRITKNGVVTSRIVNVTIPPHDTAKLNIFY